MKKSLIIKELIKQNHSINEISKLIKVSKGTIYYHYKKLKGRKNKLVIINPENEKIGEFLGLFCGDGYIKNLKNYKYKVQLCFNSKDKLFVNELKNKLLKPLFNKLPIEYTKDSNLNIYYYSKKIYDLVFKYVEWDENYKKTYTVDLITKNHSKPFKIGFLRGSLDSDGHYSNKKIVFSSVSKNLIKTISSFLKELKIKHSTTTYIDKRKNRVPITHLQILKRSENEFIHLIKPRLKKKGKASLTSFT